MRATLNRALSKIIPQITASAAACEYERRCVWSAEFRCYRLYTTYTNCHLTIGGCGSCSPSS